MPGVSVCCIIRKVAVNLYARELYLRAEALYVVIIASYFYVMCIAQAVADFCVISYVQNVIRTPHPILSW